MEPNQDKQNMTKTMIVAGLVSGIIYGGLMALMDYYEGNGFRIYRFLFHLLFFGLFMGFWTGYSAKKQSDKKRKSE